MSTKKRKSDEIVRSIERKFGVDLAYKTDAELHKSLKERGVPSLSKLLKLVHS